MIESNHILEMLATNREYLKRKNNTALENLSMLHSSFDELGDEGTILALALNDAIAAMTFKGDYARAIRISQLTLDRFPRSKYLDLVALHEILIGRCYTFSNEFERAKERFRRAEVIVFETLPQTDETQTLRADLLHETAMAIGLSRGDRQIAVRYLEKALRILGHIGHRSRRGVCIMAIGNIRFSEGRYEDAQNYYMRAEDFLEGSDDYYNLSAVLCNQGVCHMCLGTLIISETYITRSLDMRLKYGNYGDIASSYYNLACLYEAQGDIPAAYKTMLVCRDYALISQIKELQIRVVTNLELMSQELGDVDAATRHKSHLQALSLVRV